MKNLIVSFAKIANKFSGKRQGLTLMQIATLFILLPLVNASLGTFMQGECVDIKTILNATQVNISSLSYPNSTVAIIEQIMTKSGYTFNYTYCNTTQLGTYIYDYYDENGNVYVNDFEVTPNGIALTTQQSIIYLIFLIAAIGVFFLCLYYAIKLPWANIKDEEGFVIGINDLKYVKLFCIVMSYIILMMIFGMLRGITANYVPEIGIAGFFDVFFFIMLSALYPLIICSLVFAVIIYITNKKFLKAIAMGLPEE